MTTNLSSNALLLSTQGTRRSPQKFRIVLPRERPTHEQLRSAWNLRAVLVNSPSSDSARTQQNRRSPLGEDTRTLAAILLSTQRPRSRSPIRASEKKGANASLANTATTHSTAQVMILPQVHLRKPCYDFYFL